MSDKVRELAAKTAAEIRENGWTAGTMGFATGPCCLAAAIARVAHCWNGWELSGDGLKLAEAIADRTIPDWREGKRQYIETQPANAAVIEYNDEHTEDEVLAVLDQIAAA